MTEVEEESIKIVEAIFNDFVVRGFPTDIATGLTIAAAIYAFHITGEVEE